jgi:L-2-hydroxyglutarate oxidase LhgO
MMRSADDVVGRPIAEGRDENMTEVEGIQDSTFDVAVIGAGIVGLAVARETLRRYPQLRMVVVDQESGTGRHQTGHNSGVIHSGVYYLPGSLKARLCVEGARLMYEFCDAAGIDYERCGKLIVALTERELAGLDELQARGEANGVPGLRRLGAEEIAEIEPECRGLSALHCPSTGIVDYSAVVRALERELRAAGVTFRMQCQVDRLERVGDTTRIRAGASELRTRFVIACAGLWSDRLAVSAGAPRDPQIVPFRGAYLTLKPSKSPVVRGLVYPVPDPDLPFLGVHVTKSVSGQITLGPTAMLVWSRDAYRLTRIRLQDVWDILTWPGTWRLAARYWRTGISEIRMALSRKLMVRAASSYVPQIGRSGLLRETTSGVRAQALGLDGKLVDDFVISATPGAIHVRNAPSPAATSSLALAGELLDRIEASTDWAWGPRA